MWCGVVWCGVVWCGVVWCGVVWCGVVWCGVMRYGVVWCGVMRYGVNTTKSHVVFNSSSIIGYFIQYFTSLLTHFLS